MKILYRDLKHGRVKLKVENLDDLWYLSNVVNAGDLVKAKTERRIKSREDIARAGKSERRSITIAVRVEKADFQSERDTYRITGIIEQCPEDLISIGSHHTINVEKGTILTIIKDRWSGFDLQRLKDAERSALRPKLLIAVIDEGEVNLGLVRESKIEHYDLSKLIGGKYEIKGRRERKLEFYKDTAEFISNILKKVKVSALILAGAGFEKENFHKFLNEKYPEIAEISVLENIGSHGRTGINEVMKRAKVEKIGEEINAAREIRIIHRLLKEIGNDSGLGVYGLDDVENAAGMGAVEILLVCDDLFLKNRERIERIMQNVKSTRGDIHIVNHEGEAGKQLSSLGGIAGILRFKIH